MVASFQIAETNGLSFRIHQPARGLRAVCPIKGTARYFHVRVGDALNVNAAWTYPDPTPGAEGIRDHIAFWKGVEVA